MRKYINVIALVLVLFSAKGQLTNYSYCRELKPVEETNYYDLNISSSILDRPGYFRIYEIKSDTTEVPYLSNYTYYNSNVHNYARNLKIIDKVFEPGKFSYATLIVDTNIIYNSLYLNFESANFFKDVTIEGSNGNKHWKTIIENEKVFNYYREPGDHYFRNKVVFDPVSFPYIRVRMNDINSPKIELGSASLQLEKNVSINDGEPIQLNAKRNEDKKNKQTIIECTFPRKFLVNDIKLNVANVENFHRNVTIYLASVNASGKESWIRFGDGTISSRSNNVLYLDHYNAGDEAFHSQKLRVVIDNLDDRPLEKIDVDAFTKFETVKVKLHKDRKYILAYGNSKDATPQYDLEHFKNAIPATLKIAELLIEKQIIHAPVIKPEPLMKSKVWIWVTLIVSIAVVGIFAFNLLRKSN